MKKLWILLLLLLCPAVEDDDLPPEDDETPPEDDETPPEDDETPPEDEDETPPDDDEDEVPRETRGQKAIRELRERSQVAEQRAQAAEAALEQARRSVNTQQQAPTQAQQMFEQEEAALRNPDTNEWQKYAIQSARAARAAELNSQNALRQAADLADRTRFEQLKVSKPKMFEKYAPKVEELLREMRSKGNDAPRDELLALLMGRDMRDGKLTDSKKSAKPNGGAERGRTPGVRSSVPTKGNRMTDAEKRAKRLDGVII